MATARFARAALVALLLAPAVAFADSYTGTLRITCTDASDFGPGVVTLNRDNTGTGLDAFQIVATDGGGLNLVTFNNSLPLGTYVFGDLIYTTLPRANPITVTFTSLAGNSLGSQTVFSISGTCQALANATNPVPALSQWSLAALLGLMGIIGVVALRRWRA